MYYINYSNRFINQEAQMMHRLLARSGADPESRAKVEQMQFQHGKSLRPRQFNLGYPGTNFFFGILQGVQDGMSKF